MKLMKKLRILFPGCPYEAVLDAKLAATEQMRSDLADMVETATTMTIAHKDYDRTVPHLRKVSG